MIKLFLLLTSVVLLASCVTAPPIHSLPPNAQQWETHQQNMLALTHWQLRGKVAMHNGNEGGQADVFWQQTDAQTYEIRLVAPLGSGSSVLTANPEQAMLTLSNGESATAATVDELLKEIPDWKFPVSGLRFWLLGIASPQSAVNQMNWDEQGRLALLEQDGWRIELQNYAPFGDYFLPRKIMMRRLDKNNIDVKLLIREWTSP